MSDGPSREGRKAILGTVVILGGIFGGSGWLVGFSSNPPDGKTGSPGDGLATCRDCHSAASLNSSSSDLSLNVPATYTPGQTYNLTFTISNDAAGGNGFQATAERTANNAKIGTFSNAGAGSSVSGSYWKHSSNAASWTVQWTAPGAGNGTVRFYAIANKGGASPGGNFHQKTFDSTEATPPPVPSITTLSPAFGSVNAAVTITGTDFGATSSTVTFSGGTSTGPVTSWNDTAIVVRATGSASGDVVVTNANGSSPAKPFALITAAPSISSATPAFGNRDAGNVTVGVTGTNLSPGAVLWLSTTTPGLLVSSAAATGVTIATTTQATGAAFNLSGMTTGYWTLNALNPDGRSGALAGAFLVQVPPVRPVGLSVQVLSSTTLRWTWTNEAGNADGVRLVTSSGGAATADLGPATALFDEAAFTANQLVTRAVRAFNVAGSSTSLFVTTATLANSPTAAAAPFSGATETAFTAAWSANGNPAGTRYDSVVSTAAPLVLTHAGNVAVSTRPEGAPAAAFSGLRANTTYQLFVAAVSHSSAATAYAQLGTTSTLANAPAAAGSSFSGLSTGSVTLAWSANGNPAGTLYAAALSTASPLVETHAGNVAVSTRPEGTPSAPGAGLTPNTTYFLFARAFNHGGTPTSYNGLGSTATLPSPPATAASTFSSVAANSMTGAWEANGNPAGTRYQAVLSTSSSLVLTDAGNVAVSTAPQGAPSAPFGGLTPNTTYQLFVAAVGHGGSVTPYASLGSTATLPAAPAAAAIPFSAVGAGSLSGAWEASGNPPGTRYDAVLSTATPLVQTHAGNVAVSTAPQGAPAASFSGLASNATYFLFARAFGHGDAATVHVALGSTATLASPPAAAAETFSSVAHDGLVGSWSASGNPAGTRYEAALSTASPLVASHAGNVSVSTSPQGAPSAPFAGLAPNTTYFLSARAFNRGETPTAFVELGAAVTLATATVSPTLAAVSSSSVVLSWGTNGNPQGTRYEVSYSSVSPLSSGFSISTAPPTTSTFAALGGLLAATTYEFRVRALGHGGTPSAFSGIASTTTLPPLPGMPGTPVAIALGVSSISWTWTASSFTDSYQVFAASDLAAPIASPASNAFTQTGLSTNAARGIVVRGVNATGTGPLSGSSTAYTQAAAPAGLAVASRTSNGIALGWEANGNSAGTRYELSMSTDAFALNFSTPIGLAASHVSTSASVAGLTLATTYHFRLRAFNGDGLATAFSAAVTTATLSFPSSPSGFAGAALSTGDIRWSWTDNSPDEAGFLVYSSSGGRVSPALPAGTTEWLQAGLPPDSPLQNYVVASAPGGAESPPSNAFARRTLASAPSGMSASAVSGSASSLRVGWSSGAAGGYSLERATASAGTFAQLASSGTLGASATSYLDTGLSPATTYHYRVRGFNGEGVPTDYAASTSAATHPPPPAAPTLSGVALSTTSVLWSWSAQPGVSTYSLRAATGGAIAELGGAATSYLESGLTPGASVAHLLRASNGAGSADSSTTTVHLPSGGVAVPAASSATFSLGGATVTIPAGALGGAGTAIGSPDPIAAPLLPTTPADIDRANRNLIGQSPVPGTIRQFLAFTGAERYSGNFQGGARATIVIAYPDADGDGVVDGISVRAEFLKLHVLSEGGSSWSPLSDSAVDGARREVRGTVEHFSIFAIIGAAPSADISNVRVFPNPFLPGQGHTQVNIVNLPSGASLRLYTLAGELVDRLDGTAAGQAAWNGRNSSGRAAASGVYFLVVEGAGGRRVLKVAVER